MRAAAFFPGRAGARAACAASLRERQAKMRGSKRVYDQADALRAREALVPLHRIAEAGPDIAGSVAFLLGPDAAYMTGHNLLVDGGLLDSVQTHLAGRPRTEG